jgi:hypothetical protein
MDCTRVEVLSIAGNILEEPIMLSVLRAIAMMAYDTLTFAALRSSFVNLVRTPAFLKIFEEWLKRGLNLLPKSTRATLVRVLFERFGLAASDVDGVVTGIMRLGPKAKFSTAMALGQALFAAGEVDLVYQLYAWLMKRDDTATSDDAHKRSVLSEFFRPVATSDQPVDLASLFVIDPDGNGQLTPEEFRTLRVAYNSVRRAIGSDEDVKIFMQSFELFVNNPKLYSLAMQIR